MVNALKFPSSAREGIHAIAPADADELAAEVLRHVGSLAQSVEVRRTRDRSHLSIHLTTECASWLSPDGGTLELTALLGLDPNRPADRRAEIVVALLLSPVPARFANARELASALRVRADIIASARATRLDFDTQGAERPDDFRYDDERGFVLRENRSLLDALRRATQPRHAGRRYSFSCWRATEYVLLLAIAREAAAYQPELYARLTLQAQRRALKGPAFDRAFLQVHGSNVAPLATRYFVGGDRTWFRNPDRASSEVAGFEGSYTFYLGGGRFADFWHDDRSDSFASKCLRLFYWRHALERAENGELRVDEPRVDAMAAAALERPAEMERVLELMARVQASPERFEGGCVDPTRDHVRSLVGSRAALTLPDVGSLPLTLVPPA